MTITIFESLTKKEAKGVIDASEWMKAIRDGKYKNTVDQVRSMILLGDKDKARLLKMKLPASVWAGDCRTGRFYKNTVGRTGCAVFDFDNLEEEQIQAARSILRSLPWVVALHVTASGRGLRVIANIGIVHIDVYRYAYETVADRLHDITGLEPDMACKDFARASFASFDPEAYYNPGASVYTYSSSNNPLNYIPATGADPSEDFRIPKEPFIRNTEPVPSPTTCQSAPDTDSIIHRFFSRNPYSEGSRTRTMLRLGLYMRWRRIQPWQLDEAIAKACLFGVQSGITEKEIRRAVKWGYEHGSESGDPEPNRVHLVQKGTMFPISPLKTTQNPENKEYKEGEETDEDEIIEKECTPFDDEIFNRLPEELQKLLVTAKDKRERDVSLLSAISILSTMFPALRTIYGNKKYSAHLYVFIVASAGSGKGAAMNAVTLAKKTDKELDRMYVQSKKEYEKKMIEWELECRKAMKEQRLPDMDKKPVEPNRQTVLSTPNTSKSQMIIDVKNAGEEGLAITSSEADVMVEALHTDYGNHAAELRMFFHHEEVRQRFKIDKEPIVIEHPRVAILMTGTPDQTVSLFKSTENGLFSRFLFYMMDDNPTWKSQSPLDGNGSIETEELYNALGEKLKENFFRTRGKEIMIHFTRAQWDIHNEVFDTELSIISAEGRKNSGAMVKRHGLIAIRIAMVLCGLRLMEAGWQVKEYTCTDEDFNTAIHIALRGILHSAHISTIMKEMESRNNVSSYFRLLPILRSMPDKFRYSDFVSGAKKYGYRDYTAKRALKKYTASGLLSKSNGLYRKTSKLKKRYI